MSQCSTYRQPRRSSNRPTFSSTTCPHIILFEFFNETKISPGWNRLRSFRRWIGLKVISIPDSTAATLMSIHQWWYQSMTIMDAETLRPAISSEKIPFNLDVRKRGRVKKRPSSTQRPKPLRKTKWQPRLTRSAFPVARPFHCLTICVPPKFSNQMKYSIHIIYYIY